MRAIEGKNVEFQALYNDEWIPFACQTSLDFYYDTELIEKTTVSSGRFKEWAAGLGEWGFALNLVTHAAPVTTMLTVFDTLLEALRKNGLDVRAIYEDTDGNMATITGHVLIPHTGITSAVEGFSEDDIELKGSGAFSLLTQLQTPPNDDEEVFPISPVVPEGNLETVIPELVGVPVSEILSFERDGIGKQIIVVGDPTDKQVKYVQADGKFILPYPAGAGEWFLILRK